MLFGRAADARRMLLKLTLDARLDASWMLFGCAPDALDAPRMLWMPPACFGCFRLLLDAFNILDVGCWMFVCLFVCLFVLCAVFGYIFVFGNLNCYH